MPDLLRSTLWRINRLIYSERYAPHWGWHDDHRETDHTPEYLPALMQVKSEFTGIAAEIFGAGLNGGTCLQLGMGESRASHEIWNAIFEDVLTISLHGGAWDGGNVPAGSTHSQDMIERARGVGPFDFLWIDAGHDLQDVTLDYVDYGPLVRKGGIIAFHDALPRVGFPEVGVPAFIDWLRDQGRQVYTIGTEVGVAWTVAS